MGMINTEDYLPLLRQIANRYNVPFEDIAVVPDIMRWSEEHGVVENNPWRVGKCLRNRNTRQYRILILSEISPDSLQSVMDAISLHGANGDIGLLNQEKYFLSHLLLHEIAHAINEAWSERECDEWAFKELNKLIENGLLFK